MRIMRRRKTSVNQVLGITKAKREIARSTGIPATKAGRKRKALNTMTGGAYGKYQRNRAAIRRPYNNLRHPATPMGCMVAVCGGILTAAAILLILI